MHAMVSVAKVLKKSRCTGSSDKMAARKLTTKEIEARTHMTVESVESAITKMTDVRTVRVLTTR